MEAVEVAKNLIKKRVWKKKGIQGSPWFRPCIYLLCDFGKLLNLQEPPVPHLQNGTSNTCLTEPLGGLYKVTLPSNTVGCLFPTSHHADSRCEFITSLKLASPHIMSPLSLPWCNRCLLLVFQRWRIAFYNIWEFGRALSHCISFLWTLGFLLLSSQEPSSFWRQQPEDRRASCCILKGWYVQTEKNFTRAVAPRHDAVPEGDLTLRRRGF